MLLSEFLPISVTGVELLFASCCTPLSFEMGGFSTGVWAMATILFPT